jgi:hypothetical protein
MNGLLDRTEEEEEEDAPSGLAWWWPGEKRTQIMHIRLEYM